MFVCVICLCVSLFRQTIIIIVMAFDHERKVKTLSSPIEFYLLKEVSICYEWVVMCHQCGCICVCRIFNKPTSINEYIGQIKFHSNFLFHCFDLLFIYIFLWYSPNAYTTKTNSRTFHTQNLQYQ